MTGTSAVDVDHPGQSSSQASSTWSMSAMSAMEQPALRSGSSDLLVVAGEDVGRLGHEVDAAEDDELGLGLVGGQAGEPEGVAPGVGPAHDLVALVVVAEDEQPGAEGGLGARRSCRPARRRSRRV